MRRWFGFKRKKENLKDKAGRLLWDVYKDLKPFHCAKEAREAAGRADDPSLLYGEIVFSSFWDLLHDLPPHPNGAFVDIGSGAGKAVITALLSNRFDRIVGIEYLPALHQMNKTALNRLLTNPRYQKKQAPVDLYLGEFEQHFDKKATVVFINATGFFGQTLDKLITLLHCLPKDALVLITTKHIDSSSFDLLETYSIEMSWGIASLGLYRKNH